jgi:hypothetical protein
MSGLKVDVEHVNVKSFLKNVERALEASSTTRQEDVRDSVADEALSRFEKLAAQWDGGEEYKREEQRVLRGAGWTKLAAKRAARPTWPSLKFKVYKQGGQFGHYAEISTDNPLFHWLDAGTSDQSGVRGRKIVGVAVTGTAPGSGTIRNTIVQDMVTHVRKNRIRGIEPRKWSQKIAREVEAWARAKYPDYKIKVETDARG